ncbi:alpha/beta hydrolase [Rossellomorea vietnamensis]|uniref:Alpha/beta hydrolase n=1 Tax=Rossellomorea vietnamensis TaxID=218284 RepID=A0A5D4NYQ2_9BACI|nr:alpha/beta hydrolase [Rossellomorea vietnamensis]TYS18668.1 alpha/beta hydrolase [Rossellomorea vietnamensis]
MEPVFSKYEKYKRIYIDLPAHGKSTISCDFKGTEHSVENVISFIGQTIGNEDFSLLGMSYGAYAAQGIMDRMTERVEGIALIVPAVHNRTGRLPERAVLTQEAGFGKDLDEDKTKAFKTLMAVQTKSSLDLFIDEIQPGRELADREFLTSDWRENYYFLDAAPFTGLESIDVPALFLMGKQDWICGWEDQYDLFKKFTRASFIVLEGSGPMLHIEKREMASTCVEDWLKALG